VITTWELLDLGSLCTGWSGKGLWHCLEHHTSGLVSVGSIRVQGLIIHFQKKAGFHIGCNLFASELLFYLMDFSQIGITGKLFSSRIQRRMLRKTEIAPYGKRRQLPKLRHSDRCGGIGVYKIRTSPIWMSPLPPRMFSFSFAPIWMRSGSIWGRNMTFTSRIARV